MGLRTWLRAAAVGKAQGVRSAPFGQIMAIGYSISLGLHVPICQKDENNDPKDMSQFSSLRRKGD